MIDIQEITRKIIEEKENIIAKAFTVQIGELLKENGIVPVMTEYTKQDIDNITDASEYKMVTEFGVAFKELDTSKHDAQVKADAIYEFGNWLSENGYDSSAHNIKAWITEYNLKDRRAEQLKEK